jgi:hypothetical protein
MTIALEPIPGCDETKPLHRWVIRENAEMVAREMGGLDCADTLCCTRHPIKPTYSPPVFTPRRRHQWSPL